MMMKVNNFRDGCDDPGEQIQKKQCWDGMNPSKYGVDPYDTEHAGSHE